MVKIKDHSLYLVISAEYGRGRTAEEIARLAIAGGVDLIQLREKNKVSAEIIETARKLAALCRKAGVLFIVNDDPRLASEAGADGVHLGQEDLKRVTIDEARDIVGRNKIIGISTSSLEEVEAANLADVDYIAFGPVFRTTIKDNCVGTKDVERVLKLSRHAVFFIGGINLSNVGELLAKSAKNISLIRAILEADDITAMTKNLKTKLNEVHN